MVCERWRDSTANESMRNESLYVPSRVNRDKLFFMFSSYIKTKIFVWLSLASHNKVMKC